MTISITTEHPDVEGAMRTYLRAASNVHALVGNRVFFGVPKSPTWPLVTVALAGGIDDPSDAPVDQSLLQIDCWGEINESGTGIKAGATALVNAVRSAVWRLNHSTYRTSGCVLHGGAVVSAVWLPDPDTDRPRYSVTAEVTATLP